MRVCVRVCLPLCVFCVTPAFMVPVIRLEDILRKVPASVEIEFIKIDAQGHDFEVVQGIGRQLSRVKRILAEVQTGDTPMSVTSAVSWCDSCRLRRLGCSFAWGPHNQRSWALNITHRGGCGAPVSCMQAIFRSPSNTVLSATTLATHATAPARLTLNIPGTKGR